MHANHEEADTRLADTRLILHSCEAVKEGYHRVLVHTRDTDKWCLQDLFKGGALKKHFNLGGYII